VKHGGADLGTFFFQKPFDVDDLIAKVRELLAATTRSRPARNVRGRHTR
jgi:hypothetical protein